MHTRSSDHRGACSATRRPAQPPRFGDCPHSINHKHPQKSLNSPSKAAAASSLPTLRQLSPPCHPRFNVSNETLTGAYKTHCFLCISPQNITSESLVSLQAGRLLLHAFFQVALPLLPGDVPMKCLQRVEAVGTNQPTPRVSTPFCIPPLAQEVLSQEHHQPQLSCLLLFTCTTLKKNKTKQTAEF